MALASYLLYGLALQTDLTLPCSTGRARAEPRVRLTSGARARFAWPAPTPDISPPRWFCCRPTDDGGTHLVWSGLFEFLISPDGRRVEFHQLGRAPIESLVAYLLGQVLSFPLLKLGFEPLHATVVVAGGNAFALLGDCGHGKSTLAAALVARGFPVLTDDLMVLESGAEGWVVYPGIPRLKLFPSVARRMLGHDLRGTPMNNRTAKLVIPLAANQAVSRAVPLKALYVLPEPRGSCNAARSIRIDSVSGSDAFLELVRATFNLIVTDEKRLAQQFAFVERLAASVPLRRLSYRRSFAALPAVCDAILADVIGADASPRLKTAAKRSPSRGSSATT